MAPQRNQLITSRNVPLKRDAQRIVSSMPMKRQRKYVEVHVNVQDQGQMPSFTEQCKTITTSKFENLKNKKISQKKNDNH